MHQRATYESLVKDTILEPKDKISLPDRQASILRRMQQLTRYDESEFLDLHHDNENILKERAQQVQLHKIVANDPGGSIAEETAKKPNIPDIQSSSGQPPDQPPGGGASRIRMPSNTPKRSSSGPPTQNSSIKQRIPTTTTTARRRTEDSGSNSRCSNFTNVAKRIPIRIDYD